MVQQHAQTSRQPYLDPYESHLAWALSVDNLLLLSTSISSVSPNDFTTRDQLRDFPHLSPPPRSVPAFSGV
jgi:hypothetical protein